MLLLLILAGILYILAVLCGAYTTYWILETLNAPVYVVVIWICNYLFTFLMMIIYSVYKAIEE